MLSYKSRKFIKFFTKEALIILALFFIVLSITGSSYMALVVTGLQFAAKSLVIYLHKKIWGKIYENEYNSQEYDI